MPEKKVDADNVKNLSIELSDTKLSNFPRDLPSDHLESDQKSHAYETPQTLNFQLIDELPQGEINSNTDSDAIITEQTISECNEEPLILHDELNNAFDAASDLSTKHTGSDSSSRFSCKNAVKFIRSLLIAAALVYLYVTAVNPKIFPRRCDPLEGSVDDFNEAYRFVSESNSLKHWDISGHNFNISDSDICMDLSHDNSTDAPVCARVHPYFGYVGSKYVAQYNASFPTILVPKYQQASDFAEQNCSDGKALNDEFFKGDASLLRSLLKCVDISLIMQAPPMDSNDRTNFDLEILDGSWCQKNWETEMPIDEAFRTQDDCVFYSRIQNVIMAQYTKYSHRNEMHKYLAGGDTDSALNHFKMFSYDPSVNRVFSDKAKIIAQYGYDFTKPDSMDNINKFLTSEFTHYESLKRLYELVRHSGLMFYLVNMIGNLLHNYDFKKIAAFVVVPDLYVLSELSSLTIKDSIDSMYPNLAQTHACIDACNLLGSTDHLSQNLDPYCDENDWFQAVKGISMGISLYLVTRAVEYTTSAACSLISKKSTTLSARSTMSRVHSLRHSMWSKPANKERDNNSSSDNSKHTIELSNLGSKGSE